MRILFCNVCIAFVVFLELSNGTPSKPRQMTGISFAIPALNFLNPGASGGAGAGNPFRQATVTRTVVRTVSTVTQGVVKTCTTTMAGAALPACPGRRRRSVGADDVKEEATELVMTVVIGTTTITNQNVVSEMLNLPPNPESTEEITTTLRALMDDDDFTTKLYPSQDISDEFISSALTVVEGKSSSNNIATEELQISSSSPNITESEEPDQDISRAGFNFAGTTTITSTIPVTAVTTSQISGPAGAAGMASTLSITYGGCSPTSYPVTGTPCI